MSAGGTGRVNPDESPDGHTCGIRTDGTLTCWGKLYPVVARPPAGRFTQVDDGGYLACGVESDDHSVACWGD